MELRFRAERDDDEVAGGTRFVGRRGAPAAGRRPVLHRFAIGAGGHAAVDFGGEVVGVGACDDEPGAAADQVLAGLTVGRGGGEGVVGDGVLDRAAGDDAGRTGGAGRTGRAGVALRALRSLGTGWQLARLEVRRLQRAVLDFGAVDGVLLDLLGADAVLRQLGRGVGAAAERDEQRDAGDDVGEGKALAYALRARSGR